LLIYILYTKKPQFGTSTVFYFISISTWIWFPY